jgi:hypothetical protein
MGALHRTALSTSVVKGSGADRVGLLFCYSLPRAVRIRRNVTLIPIKPGTFTDHLQVPEHPLFWQLASSPLMSTRHRQYHRRMSS